VLVLAPLKEKRKKVLNVPELDYEVGAILYNITGTICPDDF
jgi:hypothetical protein